MVYLQYAAYKLKYEETQRLYDEILSEKQELFQRTQPGAVNYDMERVSGGTVSNKYDEYISQKDKKRIDERLNEIRSILDERSLLLRQKEKELRESADVRDKVYYMRILDHVRIYKIANANHYSEAQIYRILHDIMISLKHDRK